MIMMMMVCCSISCCTADRQSLFILHHIVDRPKREKSVKKEKKMMMTVTAISFSLFFLLFVLYYYSLIRSRSRALAFASDSRVRVFIDFARHPTVGYVLTLGKLIKYTLTLTHALQLDAARYQLKEDDFLLFLFLSIPIGGRDTCFAFVVVIVVAFGNPFNLEAIVIARLRLLFHRRESIVLFRGRDRKSSSSSS